MRLERHQISVWLLCAFLFYIFFLFNGCAKREEDNMGSDIVLRDGNVNIPQKLGTDLKLILGDNPKTWIISDCSEYYPWLKTGNIASIHNSQRKQVVFYIHEGQYYQLNSKEGLRYINIVLDNFCFTCEDFKNDQKCFYLMASIKELYAAQLGVFFTPEQLNIMGEESIVYGWMDGHQENLNEFYSFTKYLIEVNESRQWRIHFYTFNVDGSVDSWDMLGIIDSQKNRLRIDSITVTQVKKSGSYSFNMWG